MSGIIMGIDPASGKTSNCGIAVFDYETKDIYACDTAASGSPEVTKRIQEIPRRILEYYEHFKDKKPEIIIEAFVMRGKSGQTLQRLIGGIISHLPIGIPITEVFNTTVKKLVGGHGGSTKQTVAIEVLNWFGSNERSCEIIRELIYAEEYDILDAFAIGIAGRMKKEGEANE